MTVKEQIKQAKRDSYQAHLSAVRFGEIVLNTSPADSTAFAEARSKAAAALDRAWDAFVRLNDLRLEGN